MDNTPVGKQYAYPTLSVNKAKHSLYEGQQSKDGHYTFCAPTALVGIEIEVENVKQVEHLDYYWKMKDDGSLRNYGKEFTTIPLRATQIPYALEYLSKALQNNDLSFSPRTSVHVHLNVRDMAWDQIRVLTLLYAIFERHFFHLAGTKRESSIFCVPLYKTTQLSCLNWIEQNPKWHKYNAINLATILGDGDVPRFGTIEFRHMYGTQDHDLLCPWIDNILKLRVASTKWKYADLLCRLEQMNTTSEYIALYQDVFGEYANLEKMNKHDFEHCITATKLTLITQHQHKAAAHGSAFYKFKVLPTTPPNNYIGAATTTTMKTKLGGKKLAGILYDDIAELPTWLLDKKLPPTPEF
jgi:hypothetical protein